MKIKTCIAFKEYLHTLSSKSRALDLWSMVCYCHAQWLEFLVSGISRTISTDYFILDHNVNDKVQSGTMYGSVFQLLLRSGTVCTNFDCQWNPWA